MPTMSGHGISGSCCFVSFGILAAASSMCLIRVRSSGGIVGFRLGGDFVSEVFADHFGGADLDGVAANELGEFLLHSGELDEPGDVIRIEFDEDVYIAVG